MPIAFLTGGTGFVGGHVARALVAERAGPCASSRGIRERAGELCSRGLPWT